MTAEVVDRFPTRRDQALAFIIERITRTGTSPSYDEIGRELNVSSSRAKGLVAQLIARGTVEKTPGAQRSLRVRDVTQSRISLDDALQRLGWVVARPMGVIEGDLPKGQLSMLPPIEHLPDPD